jgi:hypothetical protein
MAAGVALTPILFLISIASGCPAFATGNCVPASKLAQFMWFPGSLMVILVLGMAMLEFFQRDQG